MSTDRSEFERRLDDLGGTVTHTDPSSFGSHLTGALTSPAVGVALDDTFDHPAVSLEGTPVDVDPAPAALRAADTGVTAATCGIADYGSVVLTPTGRGSELVSLFADRHVVVIRETDIVGEMDDAVDAIDERAAAGQSAIIATGPSATADMGALVRGVHGPEDVHVVIVEDGSDDAARRGARR